MQENVSFMRLQNNIDLSEKELSEVLVIDDDKQIQLYLEEVFTSNGYLTAVASNCQEAELAFEKSGFDLVMCDINLQGEDGLNLAKSIIDHHPETALIMITGMDDSELAEAALDFGAYGYMIKPLRVNEVLINVSNALRRRNLELQIRQYFETLKSQVYERTRELEETLVELRKALNDIIHVVALTLEMKDAYTAGHQQKVTCLACAIANEIGLSQRQIEGMHLAGLIHDLGKISIPTEILSKPTRLSPLEFELIKDHPKIGFEILSKIDFHLPIAQIVYQHHERLDGSGYPQGLKDKEIILEAKILAVADVVEAMSSHRPYRPALGLDDAFDEIEKNKGILYDAKIVDACLRLFREKNFHFDIENNKE